jgi:hypothetical protein
LEKEQNDESVELPPEGFVSPEPETSSETQGDLNEDISPPESADRPELERLEVPPSESEVVDEAKTIEPDNGEIVILDEGEAVQSGSPLETVPEPSELPPQSESAMDPEVADDTQSDEHVDERRVSFAPGTPEPKPTARKKKAAKGAKGKKKRIAVPLDEVPADIFAMIDSSFDGIPPPPPPPAPEVPGESNDLPPADVTEDQSIEREQDGLLPEGDASSDPLQLDDPKSEFELSNEGIVDVPTLPESQGGDDLPPLDSLPPNDVDEKSISPDATQGEEPSQDPIDIGDGTVVPDLPQQDPVFTFSIPPDGVEPEKPSTKKGSKSSKDKSKKKSSKSRSKESSPPPAGLGIDVGPLPVPEIDDLPQDIPPVLDDTLASSHQSEPDAENAATPPPASSETEVQGEDSKDAPSEDQEPALSDPLASDAPSRDANENDEGSQVQADPPIQQIDSVEDKNEVQEQSGDANPDLVTPNPSGEDPEGQDQSTVDVVSSPTDSGVEFEDVEKSLPGGGEETSSPVLETSEVEQIELPKGDEEETPSKDEQASTPDLESSNENAQTEEAGELQEIVSPTDETSNDAEPESGPQPAEPSDDLPTTEVEAVAVTEDSAEPPSNDVAEIQPETENKEETLVQDASAVSGVDESNEIDSSSANIASPGEGESNPPDELEPEPVSEVKPDDVEPEEPQPEVKAQEMEAETPQPDRSVEEVEPDLAKAIDEAIVDEVAVLDDPVPDEQAIVEDGPGPEAPPSPNLSKTSSSGSRKSKAAHWERKHEGNVLKEVFEDSSKVLARSKGGKDQVRIRGHAHKSRRLSSTEEDEARRRRRVLRKAEEAARLAEEERRKLEEDKQRRIRRDEKRAARKAEAEVQEKIKRLREEANKIRASGGDDEAQRKRHRDREREPTSSHREVKDAGPSLKLPFQALPKALGLVSGQSYKGRQDRHMEELQAAPSKHREETIPREPAKDKPKEESTRLSSSSGSKSHHKHRHHHRSEGDRPSRTSRESDHRPRRPVIEEERPKSFLGLLRRL